MRATMTGCYKIAGKTVAMTSLYPDVHEYCAEYRTDEAPDFAVEVTPADIEDEDARTRREYALEERPVPGFSPEILEQTAAYRKIAERLIAYDRVVFHGACVAVDGQGYLFTAKSGTGKSTHAALWSELLGERAVNVNDDKPILHVADDGVTAYGTPWTGKHHRGRNMAVPLKAICLLEQAAENHIAPITWKRAYPMLVQQTYRPRDAERLAITMPLVDRLARSVKLYCLRCNMDLSAAETAWNAMKG
jgi:hypothetical protein